MWRSKDDGQIYVSMRGTEGGGDVIANADLTVFGLARWQTIGMVNWWLKSRAPSGSMAAQIKFGTISGPGDTVTTDVIEAADPVPGDGKLTNVSSVVVNGHSLGGHFELVPKKWTLRSEFLNLFFGDSKWHKPTDGCTQSKLGLTQ